MKNSTIILTDMAELSNNERIRQIADALEELNAYVVYVGGAVIQLYSSDSAAVNPMTTYDVDCVVDITSYREFRNFEKKLYEKHFSNDTSEGAPICRYLFNGEKVDFMPKVDTGSGDDYRGEKDFEDIVFVLNSCLHLMDDVRGSEEDDIRQYLKKEFSEITARSNIREETECALPEEGRLSFVLERMTEIARI